MILDKKPRPRNKAGTFPIRLWRNNRKGQYSLWSDTRRRSTTTWATRKKIPATGKPGKTRFKTRPTRWRCCGFLFRVRPSWNSYCLSFAWLQNYPSRKQGRVVKNRQGKSPQDGAAKRSFLSVQFGLLQRTFWYRYKLESFNFQILIFNSISFCFVVFKELLFTLAE